MNASVGGSAPQQRAGGLAALYLAAAYLAAIPYFLVFVKYQGVVDPAEKVALLVGNHTSMQVMHLITYVIFGIALAVLALALNERLMDASPTLTRAATAVGLIWACVLVASGMIFNAGMAAVVGLHRTSPVQAVSAWQAIEPVTEGLGGSGGELLGGLWVLLVSVAVLLAGGLQKRWVGWGWSSALRASSQSCRFSETWGTALGCCRSCGSCGWASSCCAHLSSRLIWRWRREDNSTRPTGKSRRRGSFGFPL